jgi:hypothetical protein
VATWPFELPKEITIEKTHGSRVSDTHTVFMAEEFAFYSQCGRIGVTEMCHKPPSTEHEWNLLVNIIYDLCSPELDVAESES